MDLVDPAERLARPERLKHLLQGVAHQGVHGALSSRHATDGHAPFDTGVVSAVGTRQFDHHQIALGETVRTSNAAAIDSAGA